MKLLVLGSLQRIWTARYQEKQYQARWVQPDGKGEPRRQSVKNGRKTEREPVFRKGDAWMLGKPPAGLEIVPMEKSMFRQMEV